MKVKPEIFYLGPAGTFSEMAARKFNTTIGGDLKPFHSVKEVLCQLNAGRKNELARQFGVVPYYNQKKGVVLDHLDLIYEHKAHIAGVARVPIDLALGAYPGNETDLFPHRGVNKSYTVCSHPKALEQCENFLFEYIPNRQLISTASTAAAALHALTTKSSFAIAHPSTLKQYELKILFSDIADKRHGIKNFTDFYLVSAEPFSCKRKEFANYLTMIAVTPHFDEIGLLAKKILTVVADHQLNCAKIHSRPAIDFVEPIIKNGNSEPQMFYLEIEAHPSDPEFAVCIDLMRKKLTPIGKDVEVVRVLGTYEKPNLFRTF